MMVGGVNDRLSAAKNLADLRALAFLDESDVVDHLYSADYLDLGRFFLG